MALGTPLSSEWQGFVPASRNSSRTPIVGEQEFQRGLRQEHKRAQRSGRPFVLVQISLAGLAELGSGRIRRVTRILTSATRHTDIVGWHTPGLTLGVICTELGDSNELEAAKSIVRKYEIIARKRLTPEIAIRLKFSFEIFGGAHGPWRRLSAAVAGAR